MHTRKFIEELPESGFTCPQSFLGTMKICETKMAYYCIRCISIASRHLSGQYFSSLRLLAIIVCQTNSSMGRFGQIIHLYIKDGTKPAFWVPDLYRPST